MAAEDASVSVYLPAFKENRPPNRTYLFNVSLISNSQLKVINSLKPAFFRANINGVLSKRKELYTWKRSQFIEVTPQMLDLIQSSSNIPLSKKVLHYHSHRLEGASLKPFEGGDLEEKTPAE